MTLYLKQLAATALLLLVSAAAVASNGHLNIPTGTNLPVRISEHLNSDKASQRYLKFFSISLVGRFAE